MNMKMDIKIIKKYNSPLLDNPNIKKMLEVSPEFLSIIDRYENKWIKKVSNRGNKSIASIEMRLRTLISTEIQIFVRKSRTWSYDEKSKKRLTFNLI